MSRQSLHNGLKNIISHMGGEDFIRVRVGVGGPGEDMVDHVLGHFGSEDAKIMKEAFVKAADAVECILSQGPDKAMNIYNTKPAKTPQEE